ncbi:phosphatase PAP2 family protein [Crocinitomix algicola]|uniref:phosphatase PAP2 family protein n=1 Tax=Crocinitomix algicola TaxID=1740263 RepID=UPI000834F099|nr:phosphatase PAP2 family protein [Crocinitomix algicola]
MLEKLEGIDQSLFLYLNSLRADWLDPVMWYFSSIGLMIPVFAYILFYSYKKKGWPFMLMILLGLGFCILLSDRISVELFKEVFQRYRPTHNGEIGELVQTVIKPNGEEYRGGLFSFVSSHATNTASLAVFTFLHLRQFSKYWVFIFIWMLLVSYTRIYLGVHYPADIIGGMILGGSIGAFLYWISLRVNLFKWKNNE